MCLNSGIRMNAECGTSTICDDKHLHLYADFIMYAYTFSESTLLSVCQAVRCDVLGRWRASDATHWRNGSRVRVTAYQQFLSRSGGSKLASGEIVSCGMCSVCTMAEDESVRMALLIRHL